MINTYLEKENPNITILDPLATCKTVFQGKESACIFFFNAVQWFALKQFLSFLFPGNIYAAQGSLCSVLGNLAPLEQIFILGTDLLFQLVMLLPSVGY